MGALFDRSVQSVPLRRRALISSLLLLLLLRPGHAFAVDLEKDIPSGWKVHKVVALSSDQCESLSQRFGGTIASIKNVIYAVGPERCQLNEILCVSAKDAAKVHTALLEIKEDPSALRLDGVKILELVCQNPRLARQAKYEFGLQPSPVTYRVSFDAAPLKTCDYMAWNRVFNLFLQLNSKAADDVSGRSELELKIATATKDFVFGDQLTLRRYGQGSKESKYSFDPPPKRKSFQSFSKSKDLVTYYFEDLPERAGIPFVRVAAEVTSETQAMISRREISRRGKPFGRLTQASAHWPSHSTEIKKLAGSIVTGQSTTKAKLAAILGWLAQPKNFKYSGEVTGSRYGVAKALDQGFGHCWDYSDIFVTLCRASGVPARQVAGWLHGVSGHVWAEVFVPDEGWRQVDPTSAMGCGSDYVPYLTSERGDLPLLYLSSVKIEILNR